ncbi:hypothetical protein EVAR_62770_1 [Eumeta japonica]|uniref:Uncharacterized protein n=1 Tax=Eumeta variegata TaxID=151549 RepID=A0A4C1ZN43_EUMVA|nr:hypothetical protein EVAR_62770_1 [Eumeta japonica]
MTPRVAHPAGYRLHPEFSAVTQAVAPSGEARFSKPAHAPIHEHCARECVRMFVLGRLFAVPKRYTADGGQTGDPPGLTGGSLILLASPGPGLHSDQNAEVP